MDAFYLKPPYNFMSYYEYEIGKFSTYIKKYADAIVHLIPIFNQYNKLKDEFIRKILDIITISDPDIKDEDKLTMIFNFINKTTIADIDKKLSTHDAYTNDCQYDTYVIEQIMIMSNKEAINIFNLFYESLPVEKIKEDQSKIIEFISKLLVEKSKYLLKEMKSSIYDLKTTILSQMNCKDKNESKILKYIDYVCISKSSVNTKNYLVF